MRALRPQLRRRCTSVLITEDSDGEVRVDELPPPAASSDASCQTPAFTPAPADTAHGESTEARGEREMGREQEAEEREEDRAGEASETAEPPPPRGLEECVSILEVR